MGQQPIYVHRNTPSITIKRITKSTIDELKDLVYDGLYDTGATKIPLFKERE